MKNTQPKVVVLGSINMDFVIQCAQFPLPGQTILADSSSEFCGGKGANQAVAASMSSGNVSMIGAVGDDAFASQLIANLENRGVDCRSVMTRPNQASGVAIITVDDTGQNSIVVVPGANATVTPDDVTAMSTLIQSADVLLVQLEIPISSVLQGIKIAKDSDTRVILDPAPAPNDFPQELLQVDLICPNESEASDMTGVEIHSPQEAEHAAIKLHRLGAKNVAITMGENGTLLFDGHNSTLLPALSVDVVDTTGSGDAFAGALAVQWSRTDNLHQAVDYANAAGAFAASKRGAQTSIATENEITALTRNQS